VRAFRSLFRLVWGDDVERELRPVLAVSFVGAAAMSSLWTYIGIWAIRELGASSSQLGVAFLLAAVAGMGAGYLGGHLSDTFGRKPLMVTGYAVQSAFVLSYLTVGDRVWLGIGLVVAASAFGAVGGGASLALVADAVPRERHEAAYASVRVASNLGVVLGPPIGAVLLLGDDWSRLFVGVSLMAVAVSVFAARFLPSRGAHAPEAPPERGSFGVIRRDRVFLLFVASGALAYLVYVSWETVLPISAVDTHGLSPSTWGFIVILNPLLVTTMQLRLTRRLQQVGPAPKLVVAMLLMGFPFLLLTVSGSIAMFLVVAVIFVVGEMLWVPTSQAIVARLAPADVRGAYMGAFGSTASFGFAIGPFVALQLREAGGDGAAWTFFAAVSIVAAFAGWLACRLAFARGGGEELPAPASAPV
jgi:predicted MFS family arabinose efflux permease